MSKQIPVLLAFLLGLAILAPGINAEARADSLTCRGLNRAMYAKNLRLDVRAALIAAGHRPKSVRVSLGLVEVRPRVRFVHDFSSEIAIDEAGRVTFLSESLPPVEPCEVQAVLRIKVIDAQGNRVHSVPKPITLSGSMLQNFSGIRDLRKHRDALLD